MSDPKNRIPAVAVVGATATGKTALSIELCRRLDGEVIACDSRTVYRYFDIGAAKPTTSERQGIPHHLIDVADPGEEFTAAQFAELGATAMDDIASRGKIPVVCGGTGFYSKALLEGLSIPRVGPDPELRAELKARAKEQGNESLHNELAKLDPETAARLAPNDTFRVIRALEVCLLSGKPFSEMASVKESPYDTTWIGLEVSDREKHRELIAKRLQEQLDMGLLEETKALYEKYGANQRVLHTVNYRDLVAFIEGELTWEQALEGCIRHNYQLSRKQSIWFRANKKIHWFQVDLMSKEDILAQVMLILTGKGDSRKTQ